jgi:hypothetical protein
MRAMNAPRMLVWLAVLVAATIVPVQHARAGTPTEVAETQTAAATPAPETTVAAGSTPTAEPSPSETQALPTEGAATPPLVVARLDRLAGQLIVDTTGDAQVTAGETGARTLVELVSSTRVFSIYTNDDGSFEFRDVPNGDYELWIWWGPGFVTTDATPTNTGLAIVKFSVDKEGRLAGSVPDRILGKPNLKGAIPYPVRSGGGAIAVGSISLVGGAGEQPVGLPDTGTGGSSNNDLALVLGGALLAFAVASGLYLASSRRRAS